ncbi:amidohydrolase [Drepanopeziza brunnea f. sp. 'multigermtubi' MB_m1]|uniref:Amidohydrolase n=1 Tax=Marssonina brunnea f. sp. multigermtubi (strain MB_m1) TaxID=1072389 RepID=K1Y7Z2_MARBU|nr:amidohydrolase [Drepanopeziza brunnea f. sp. 'multigermtubi' MB_m1]EKD21234.1 amidohydrolase [Drepanopeziza brunnea f. sp. 'multigermtubi' MB_m1]
MLAPHVLSIAACLLLTLPGVHSQSSNTTNSSDATTIYLQGGTIVTYNPATSSIDILRNSSILIADGEIVSVGETPSPDVLASAEIVNVVGKIISPGFIDTHRHDWQTAYKTMASNTSLVEYFQRYGEFSPTALSFTAEDVYINQLYGLYEALNSGTTTTLDHASHTWSKETSKAGLQASVDSGARVLWTYAIHELGDAFTIDEQFQDLEELANDAEGLWTGTATNVGLAYDRIPFGPAAEVQRAFKLANDLKLSVITAHHVGGPYGYGRVIQVAESYSVLNSTVPIVFSHSSSLTQDEAVLLRKYDQFVSITPESEHHYGHDHPNSYHIQDQSSLGVDTHFTFSSDIITQARLWLQATRLRLYRKSLEAFKAPLNNPMSHNQAFILATYNGARSLRREDIGIIAPGAKADIVVIDGESPNMLGWKDPVGALILHSNVGDIEHVIVDGKFKKRDGKLLVDFEATKERFMASVQKIQSFIQDRDWPVLEGEYSEGILYGMTDTVDVLRGDGNGY